MDIGYLIGLILLLTANCPQSNAENNATASSVTEAAYNATASSVTKAAYNATASSVTEAAYNATEKDESFASEYKVQEVPAATLDFIEDVTRRILAKGITTLKVPSVEPLKLYDLSFYLNNSEFGIIRSTFNEVKIEGIPNFKFLNVSIGRGNNSESCSGELLTAYMKTSVHDIQVAVDVNGSAAITMLPTMDIQIHGIGFLNLSEATGFLNVTVCSEKFTMEMIQFDFDITLNETDFDLSQLNITGFNPAFVESVARNYLVKIYNSEKGVLINKATEYVKDQFNTRAKQDDNFKIIAEIIQLIYDSVLI